MKGLKMKFVHAVLLIMMLVPLTAFAQTDQTAENRRIAEIKAKRERGEQLTSEEMRFVQDVRSRQNQGKQKQAAAKKSQEYAQTHPPRDSVGFVPLTDLGKGTHKGEEGGLYPGGENVPPPAHLKAGVEIARRIVPVDGLVWLREDLAEDGMHPSTAGREKVARLLLDFLKHDATSRSWFVKSP